MHTQVCVRGLRTCRLHSHPGKAWVKESESLLVHSLRARCVSAQRRLGAEGGPEAGTQLPTVCYTGAGPHWQFHHRDGTHHSS